MELIIQPSGGIQCIYGETLDLSQLGRLQIQRASHVEPTDDGRWTADLSPVGGPTLGPFPARSEALAAEIRWLGLHLARLQLAAVAPLESQQPAGESPAAIPQRLTDLLVRPAVGGGTVVVLFQARPSLGGAVVPSLGRYEAMTQQMLNEAVARATGEDLSQISRRGFVPLTVRPYEQDEEQCRPPQVIDWDQFDLERNVALFE